MRTNTILIRSLGAVVIAAALAACGQPAPAAKDAPAAAPVPTPAIAAAGAQKDPNQESLGERYIELLPQWVPIANTSDGGNISYDLKGLKKPAEGVVDILLRITHGTPQKTTIDEPTVVRKVAYSQELVRLRYRCATQEFAIIGREIQDENAKPVLREDTPTAAFAPIKGNGMATVAYNPACAER